MNVKQLKELLKDVPDDVVLLVESRDHHYRKVRAYVVDVEEYNGSYAEYYDEHNMTPGAKVTKGIIIV